jgi:hypothetical protein
VIRMWRSYADVRMSNRMRTLKIVAMCLNGLIMRCFKGWSWFVGHCKRLRQALAYMINGRKMTSMGAWKSYAQESRLRKQQIKTAFTFWKNAACRSYIVMWNSKTKARLKAKRQLKRACAYLKHARALKMVTSWKMYVKEQEEKMKRAMQAWVGNTLQYSFREWYVFYLSESTKRKAVTKVQACCRGKLGRRYAEDYMYKMHWAASFVQTMWRGHKGVLHYKKLFRLKTLHESVFSSLPSPSTPPPPLLLPPPFFSFPKLLFFTTEQTLV